jgi:hypothetical protein
MNGPDREEVYKIVFELLNPIEARANFAAGEAIRSVETTFVFQPGGTASRNVYIDWATMIAAVNAAKGPKWIQIDGTFAQTHVPPGTWNVDNVTFTINGIADGYQFGGNTGTLYFDDGAHFTFQNLKIEQLWCVLLGSTPVAVANQGAVLTLDLGASIFGGAVASGPFLEVSTNALPGIGIFVRGGSTIGGGVASTPIFQVDAGVTQAFLYLSDASFVAGGALSGLGELVVFLSDDASVFPPQPITTLVQSVQSYSTSSNLFTALGVPVPPAFGSVIGGPQNVTVLSGNQKIVLTGAISNLLAAAGPPGSQAVFVIAVDSIPVAEITVLIQIGGAVGSLGTVLWETPTLTPGVHTVDLQGITALAGTTVNAALQYLLVNN